MLARIRKAINIDAHFKGCRRRGGGTGETCMFHSSVEWFDDGIVKCGCFVCVGDVVKTVILFFVVWCRLCSFELCGFCVGFSVGFSV